MRKSIKPVALYAPLSSSFSASLTTSRAIVNTTLPPLKCTILGVVLCSVLTTKPRAASWPAPLVQAGHTPQSRDECANRF